MNRDKLIYIISILTLLLWHGILLHTGWEKTNTAAISIPWDQAVYNQSIEGIGGERTSKLSLIQDKHFLANHFTLIFYILAPLYAFLKFCFGLPHGYVVLSSLLYLLTSLGILLAAYKRETDPFVRLLFLATLLLAAPINHIFANGFRMAPLSLLPLTMMLFAWREQRFRAFVLWSLLLLSLREDYGLVLVGFVLLPGSGLPLRLRLYPLAGLFTVYLFSSLLMPFVFGAEGITGVGRFAHLGNGPLEIVLSPLLKPGIFFGSIFNQPNYDFIKSLFLSFGLLALLRPGPLRGALPYLTLLLLNQNREINTAGIQMWYIAPLLPFLLLASLDALGYLRNKLAHRPVLLRIGAVAFVFTLLGNTAIPAYWNFESPSENVNGSVEIARSKMKAGPVYTSNTLLPFFTDRQELYVFDSHRPPSRGYVILPVNLNNPQNWFKCCAAEEYRQIVRQFAERNKAKLIYIDSNIALWHSQEIENPVGFLWGSNRIEAELTGAESVDGDLNTFASGRGARRIAPYFPYFFGKKSSYVLMGGKHKKPASARTIEVRLLLKSQREQTCKPRRRPELILLSLKPAWKKEIRLTPPRPGEYKWSSVFFEVPATVRLFSPFIQYNRCGEYFIDTYEIRYSSSLSPPHQPLPDP